MTGACVVFDHHALHVDGHDGELRVLAGKRLNRLQRFPARHDEELDAVRDVPPQDRRADESGNPLQLGKRIASQVGDVFVGVLAAGESSPLGQAFRIVTYRVRNEVRFDR